MKRQIRWAGAVAVAAAILLLAAPPRLLAQSPAASPGSTIELLSTGDSWAELELRVSDFAVESATQNGQVVRRWTIPQTAPFSEPGRPQIPVRGALLGVTSPEGVTVEILSAEFEPLTGGPFAVAPGDSAPAPSTDFFYPGKLVEIGGSGTLRDQPVAQVQFFPVQVNPATGAVRLYRRIRVRVSWPAPPPETPPPPSAPAFESMLQSLLLNYAALRRPPVQIPQAAPAELGVQVAPSPGVKIGVTAPGMVQITPADVTGAGFSLSGVDARTLKITHRGVEIPRLLTDANGDNLFNGSDSLLFYGTGITLTRVYSPQAIFSAQNIYRLEAGGAPGLQMLTRTVAVSNGSAPAADFPVTRHFQRDTHYWANVPGGEGQDHWFWGDNLSGATPVSYTLDVGNRAGGGDVTVRARLRGKDSALHQSRLLLNGAPIDTQSWSGQVPFTHTVTVSASLLQNGANTLAVQSVTGAQFYVNWFELDYRKPYLAENDSLQFGPPGVGETRFSVGNFSAAAAAQVFDITDPGTVARLDVSGPPPDASTLQFVDTAAPGAEYLALQPSAFRAPDALWLDQPSALKSPANNADYIIITHADLQTPKLVELAAHRSAAGLAVQTVLVEDIYDEFNFGIENPQAIRDFLAYVYANWGGRREYVLLAGDTSFDYRNVAAGMPAIPNRVPTALVQNEDALFKETASDNWFVANLSGTVNDVLPDMFIGRLPAQDAAELGAMVDKIIGYDTTPPVDPWNRNLLLVADNQEAGDPDFVANAAALGDRAPVDYTRHTVNVADYPSGNAAYYAIKDYINQDGALLVNYFGHGSANRWAAEGVLFSSDIPNFTNGSKLPVVTIGNCLNGYFVHKISRSMAETLLGEAGKGAAAVWAPTGTGQPGYHSALIGQFYDQIFQHDVYPLGAATTQAKLHAFAVSSLAGELLQTFVLFGDPAMELGLPPNRPSIKFVSPGDGTAGAAVDQTLQITFSKPVSPATVSLSSAQAAGLFTATWNSDFTAVTFSHPDFAFGAALTFTVAAQDKLGNSLMPNAAGLLDTWNFSTVEGAQAVLGAAGGDLRFTRSDGTSTTISVLPGALGQPTLLRYTAKTDVSTAPIVSGAITLTHVSPWAFSLEAFQGGPSLAGWPFAKPLSVTLQYGPAPPPANPPNYLYLPLLLKSPGGVAAQAAPPNPAGYTWRVATLNPALWPDAAETCSPASVYSRDGVQNRLSLQICDWGKLHSLALFAVDN